MSPLALNFFRSIPTNLELNGPKIEFTQQPENVSETLAGFATFTGICTAYFPAGMGQTTDGTFSFKWYLNGVEMTTVEDDPTSIAQIKSTIIGIATEPGDPASTGTIGITTMTLFDIDYDNNNQIVYVTADYNPVGFAHSLYLDNTEPNATNEPFKSDEVLLTSYPEIIISKQPEDVSSGAGAAALFTVEADIVPDNNTDLKYQWQLNDLALVDGTFDHGIDTGWKYWDEGMSQPWLESGTTTSNAVDRIPVALPSSGKWYFETRVNDPTLLRTLGFGWGTRIREAYDDNLIGYYYKVGIDGITQPLFLTKIGQSNSDQAGGTSYGKGSGYGGSVPHGGAIGEDWEDGDILMWAYDADEGNIWLGMNGKWFGEGGQYSNAVGSPITGTWPCAKGAPTSHNANPAEVPNIETPPNIWFKIETISTTTGNTLTLTTLNQKQSLYYDMVGLADYVTVPLEDSKITISNDVSYPSYRLNAAGPILSATVPAETVEIDFKSLSTYSNFKKGVLYTLKPNSDIATKISAYGGQGGWSEKATAGYNQPQGVMTRGGEGGNMSGLFTFKKDQEYYLYCGLDGWSRRSIDAVTASATPGGGKPGLGFGYGGGGGGYTGLFKKVTDQPRQEDAIMIAAGGGGASVFGVGGSGIWDGDADGLNGGPGVGGECGDGGGTDSTTGEHIYGSGQGGTQTRGGVPGCRREATATDRQCGSRGGALYGGDGTGGGGAGYWGGGGGGYYEDSLGLDPSRNSMCGGAGGAGSNYYDSTLISERSFVTEDRRSLAGTFEIERVSSYTTLVSTVSGANTPSLRIIGSSYPFGGMIRCRLDNGGVQISPVYSKTVNWNNVEPRDLLRIQAFDIADAPDEDTPYGSDVEDMMSVDVLLSSDNSYTLNSSNFVGRATTYDSAGNITTPGSNYSIIQFYAPERSFDLQLEMNAAAGENIPSGSNGGEGGTSTITFTVEKNVEYTLLGISNNSALFLYRQSSLIAVVGQGGEGGYYGDGREGGRGGGVNVAGEKGNGRDGGEGGALVSPGSLTLNGIFGTYWNQYAPSHLIASGYIQPGDTRGEEGTNKGGRTISCSKGSYWIDRGVGACAENSHENAPLLFVAPSGRGYTNSGRILRGFKPGYTITDTAGLGHAPRDIPGYSLEYARGLLRGNGGNGAVGGSGAKADSGGGGGGSGYTSGLVTIKDTKLGGNKSNTSFVVFSTPSASTMTEWEVSRSAAYSNRICFLRQSGQGPMSICFGPNSATVFHEISWGSHYMLSGITVNGSNFRTDQLRLFNNVGSYANPRYTTIGLEDIDGGGDNDYNDLMITCKQGKFINTHNWYYTDDPNIHD